MKLSAACALLLALFPLFARADDACWARLDAAIAHRANAAVPAYVQYHVRRSVERGGAPPLVTDQQVVYRSADGIARVTDSLYGGATRYTDLLEPGPPFVGPSGDLRAGWIESGGGGAIATVHAHAGKACDDLGAENAGGVATEHLRVTPHRAGAPGIRDVWIDASGEIRRAAVAQYLDGAALAGVRGALLVDATIEVAEIGGEAVVSAVRFRFDPLRIEGEYRFDGYAFAKDAPSGTFP